MLTKAINVNAVLTKREKEVLQLIVKGFTNVQIGEKLNISHKTVDTHRTNLMRKLNAHKVTDLIHYALYSGYEIQ